MEVEDSSGTVIAVITITIFFSCLFVGLRSYARAFIHRQFGYDDHFMVFTLVLFLINNILMLVAVRHGYGQRSVMPGTDQYKEIVKLEVIAQFFAVITYGPAKVSVAICLGRIFLGRKLIITLWTIAIFNVVGFTGMGVLQLAQCEPVARQWDPDVAGYCIKPEIYTDYCLTAASIGAASDFALALIPWWYIARLQMRLREKIAVGLAMSLGVVAGAFAIIKTVYITELTSRTDYAFDTIPLILWSAGEQCAIMVAASIPMLRPLLRMFSSSPSPSYLSNNTFGSRTKTVIGRAGNPVPPPHRSKIYDENERALVETSDGDLADGIWVEQGFEISSSSASTNEEK